MLEIRAKLSSFSVRVDALHQANGEWVRLGIALPGYSVWLRAWQVQVGRTKL